MKPLVRSLAAAAAGLAIAVAAIGCPGRPEPREVFNLIDIFKSGSVRQATQLIRFGYPEARPALVRGWHDAFRELEVPPGQLATWSTGDEAEIEFFVVDPADLELTFRTAIVRKNPDARSTMLFSVNGQPVKEIEVFDVLLLYNLTLPGSLLHRGENRLSFTHPPAPAAAVGKDIRALWDFMQFGPPPDPERQQPFARSDKDTLFLPFGTRLDFHLKLPAESALTVFECRSRAGATGRLQVSWQPIGGAETVLAEDFCSLPKSALPITGAEPTSGRLSLFALSSQPVTERYAGIVSFTPRITAHVEDLAPAPKPAGAPPQVAGNRPNILIYLVDTLRADRLGCYGYGRPTSPQIDRFAADAVLFANSQAQSPWTRASVASMLTGLWPQQHKVNDDEDQLADDAVTLPEILQQAGYRTAAITTNGNSSRLAGFSQGFDYFNYLREIRMDDPLATSEDVNQAATAWLDQNQAAPQADRRPFFLLLHTIDPHAPYTPPEPFRSQLAPDVHDFSISTAKALENLNLQLEPATPERVAALSALYDAEIAYNDASFGHLLDLLRTRGLYDATVILFVSDHGEEFYEHGGFSHGRSLYTEMLDVPLIVRLPGAAAGRKLDAIVEHVDLLPTLAELAGAPIPSGIQGRSLLPLLRPGQPEPPAWENWAVAYMNLRSKVATSFLTDQWKLIQQQREGQDFFPELYSRLQDRGELQNLAPSRPEVARMLSTARRAEEQAQTQGLERRKIDASAFDEVKAELQALGYVGGDSGTDDEAKPPNPPQR
jgi:arylsulfatase A-like enzyme